MSFPSTEKNRDAPENGLASALAPYVPPLVIEYIARNGAPLAKPLLERFPGAVLSADIAGFTPLAETLNQRGGTGVEELSRILNACFSTLIEIIEAHGGVVMKFAGDALVAVWRTHEGDLAGAARNAARCGLAIQSRVHRRDIGGTAISLRIGVGSGEILHMVLGDARTRWTSALAGTALEQADTASQHAQPGDVFASAKTWSRLGDGFVGEIANDFTHISAAPPASNAQVFQKKPLPENPESALLPHICHAARNRIHVGPIEWLAEFRPLTVLFIHITNLDCASSSFLQQCQSVIQTIQTALDRFEGMLDDLDDEPDGLIAVAAFGLPPLSHENDAARAVQAAMHIRRELREAGLGCSIGITTGRVFCGALGNATRRDYSMIGDAMNRCARLMRLAGDDIFCDAPTRLAAEQNVEFEFLKTVSVKGKSEAVSVHHPLREHAASAPTRAGMIGRRDERALIAARLAALRERKTGGLLFIEGEAGIGKSTLVSGLLAEAHDLGLRTFFGGADSIERMRGHHAWSEIFRRILDVPSDAPHAKRSAHVLAHLEAFPEIARIAPLLNPVLGLHLPENEITSRMDAPSRADALAGALARLLEAAAVREPVVVVIEDCHWLDSASWAFALDALQRVNGALFVLVARPMDAPPSQWNALLRTEGATHLRLNAMPQDDVVALVCHKLGVSDMPAPVADFILEKADGHPLFAETLAFALRDAGNIVVEHNRCHIPPGGDDLRQLKFSGTVQGVVRARIDRLPERERLAIKAASVMGRAFSPDALRAIHPSRADAVQLGESLERLAQLGFATRDGDSFVFNHAIIQEAAYELMMPSHRQVLHRDFAAWIEHTAGSEIAAEYPALAHHWTLAGQNDKAVFYLEKAGVQAMARFANREAVALLEKAILLSQPPRNTDEHLIRGRWHRMLGEAHFHLGRIDLSRRHLHEAVRLLGFPAPSPLAMNTFALPGTILRQTINRFGGGRFSRHHSARQDTLLETISTYNLLGEMAFFVNDLPTSIYCCIHGLNLAEAAQSPAKLAETYGAMMIVTAAMPPRAAGKMYMRLAMEAMRRVNDPVTLAYVSELIGIYLAGLGEWDHAQARLGAAREVFAQFGNHRRVEECHTNILYSRMHCGLFTECTEPLSEMLRSAARRGDAQTIGWSRCIHGTRAIFTEGGDAASRAIGDDETIAADTLSKAAYPAIVAAAHLRLGDHLRAREHACVALKFLAKLPPVSSVMLLSSSLNTEVCVELLARAIDERAPDVAELRRDAQRACGVVSRFAFVFPIGKPHALLWRGALDFLDGKKSHAHERWQRALESAESMQMRHVPGTIHFQIAKHTRGDERERHREEAMKIFGATGAAADLSRARELARG